MDYAIERLEKQLALLDQDIRITTETLEQTRDSFQRTNLRLVSLRDQRDQINAAITVLKGTTHVAPPDSDG